MKILIATIALMSSVSAFAYTPAYEANVTADDTITFSIDNNVYSFYSCNYSMSWLENTLTYRRVNGSVTVEPGQKVDINVKKDIAAKVTLLKAHLECDDE